MNTRISKKLLYIFFLLGNFCIGSENKENTFKLGVENFSPLLLEKICGKKKEMCTIGLITNQTGVDQKGNRTIDILVEQGIKIHSIFVTEHGLHNVAAERDVDDSIDKKTNIPIISLYGNGSGKMIAAEYINALDVLIFDIQDSGMRHYTYISTLLQTMKIAAEYKKSYIVFDRPNPLGSAMQGPLVDPELISFISTASIPLRHGMTIGELAKYFKKNVLHNPIKLYVVKMKNYDRNIGFMGNFIHQLSPNLQSLSSCYGYSFLGLLGEIEPFDVGVGTPMAFQCIMLPARTKVTGDMWKRLQRLLDAFGVKSFTYQHTKNKRKSKGLRLEFSDISSLRSFELLLAILEFFKKEKIAFSFSPAFNKAVGTAHVQAVIADTQSKDLFLDKMKQDLQSFQQKAQSCYLYDPRPIILPY